MLRQDLYADTELADLLSQLKTENRSQEAYDLAEKSMHELETNEAEADFLEEKYKEQRRELHQMFIDEAKELEALQSLLGMDWQAHGVVCGTWSPNFAVLGADAMLSRKVGRDAAKQKLRGKVIGGILQNNDGELHQVKSLSTRKVFDIKGQALLGFVTGHEEGVKGICDLLHSNLNVDPLKNANVVHEELKRTRQSDSDTETQMILVQWNFDDNIYDVYNITATLSRRLDAKEFNFFTACGGDLAAEKLKEEKTVDEAVDSVKLAVAYAIEHSLLCGGVIDHVSLQRNES